MLSTPALTLFSEPNEVPVPGLVRGACAGLVWLDCASAEPIVASSAAAKAAVALRKKRRRSNSFMEDSFAIPRFVRIPSLLAIKPDPSGQNNWTKVSAILWYQSTQRVTLDGPRRYSAALQAGPRQRQ